MTHHQSLEFIRQQIADEFSLINARLSGFSACQSFLITAFAISLGNPAVYRAGWLAQWLLPALASLLCLATLPGVRIAGRTIDQWRLRQHQLLSDPAAGDIFRAVTIDRHTGPPGADRLHRRSLWFSNWLPLVMLVFWLACFALVRLVPPLYAT